VGREAHLRAVADPARLAALRDTGLLDSGDEESFDRFTRLARELLGVEVSQVSLVDHDRQYFKSHSGPRSEFADARQSPLSHSFCQYTVSSGRPFVVEDARRDPRVCANLAVRDLDVVAYAGIPLTLRDGHTLGALCAVSTRPRVWTSKELKILTGLAHAVVAEIELRRALVATSLRDSLTGLANRRFFEALLDHELNRERGESNEVAVLSLGIDDFRLVNESLGHLAGDEVLRETARRLVEELREGDAVCRFSGDQFLVLCRGVADQSTALKLAEQTREVVARDPFLLDGGEYRISASVGIATPQNGIGSAGQLVTDADVAMRHAKEQGRAALRFARTEGRSAADARLRLQSALARALEDGVLEVHYQPIVNMATDEVVAHEALARWTDPVLGPVRPDEFIPAAERSGEIIRLGECVLRHACRQVARWRSDGRPTAYVSVNLAPQQLQQPNIVHVVRRALDDAGLPPHALMLEVTERVLLDDRPLHRRNFVGLHALGVRLALDDFGVGYSALSYLRRFPLDVLKIDRSFVDGVEGDRRAQRLVRAIVEMGTALGLAVIAEGIESPAQVALLRTTGCTLGQGYHFGRPVPAGGRISCEPASEASQGRFGRDAA
jgi:diguanylate cyclase